MYDFEFRNKLANALKDNSVEEVRAFLAYLEGYLDHEKDGEFRKLMLKAMQQTDIEKSFNV